MTSKERQDKFFLNKDRKEYYKWQYQKRKEKFLADYKNGKYRRCTPETQRKNYKKNVDNLSDSYCRHLLIDYGFKKDEITSELIELKRQQIKLKRLINEKL